MIQLNELQPLIIEWAREKDLIKLENALKQSSKTQEELDEMKAHIFMQSVGIDNYWNAIKNKSVNVKEAIKDDIGDQIVTLIIQCAIQNIDLLECLNIAWNEIKDRKGTTIDGKFIKQ